MIIAYHPVCQCCETTSVTYLADAGILSARISAKKHFIEGVIDEDLGVKVGFKIGTGCQNKQT